MNLKKSIRKRFGFLSSLGTLKWYWGGKSGILGTIFFACFSFFLYRIESRSPKRVKIFDLFFQVGLGQKIVSRKKLGRRGYKKCAIV